MLAWVVAILLLPIPYLYDNFPQFRFRLKFSVYYLWLTLASFFMIPLSLLRPGSVVNARLGSALMRPLSTLLGLGWEVEGEVHLLDREEACVILANHQSSIDLLGMFHIWSKLSRVTAIAKQSLMYYGSFGLTAYLCGTVFVDRKDPKLAAVKLNCVAQTLKVDKVKLWVFPEGTRNSDKEVEMLPFKKGAFHVAISANLPILPIVISRHHFLDERNGIFLPGSGKMTVLPLIWPEEKDVEQLMEEVRGAMLTQLRSGQ
eukprot:GFUD01025293.1.p1 GENE.GFUD01025293.1~~GFUD01025293.1.p1  ORF type:complete len:259 (-),score=82.31 GFUD01025293.1:164-940(-)